MATGKRKASTKKATAGRATASVKRIKPIKDAMTKTQAMDAISANTGLSRKQVSSVLLALGNIIHGHVKKGGAGTFIIPGLMKIKTVFKPATKAREGVNPFTGQPTVFKAKPARTAVKVMPLKKLKEMAG